MSVTTSRHADDCHLGYAEELDAVGRPLGWFQCDIQAATRVDDVELEAGDGSIPTPQCSKACNGARLVHT